MNDVNQRTSTESGERAQKVQAAMRRRSQRRGTAVLGFSAEEWPFLVVLVSNWAFAGLVFFGGSELIDWMPESWDTLEDKFLLVMRNATFAALPMVLAIAIVAKQRLNPALMVGHVAVPNSSLDINTRFVLNTAEQYVLFVVGQLGMMFFAPQENAKNLIILTAIWLLGRILFWIGYHTSPPLRAFGFGLTFYPSLMVIVWLVVMFSTGYRLF